MKLSRYVTSLVSNSRDEVSRFLTGFAEDLEEQCRQLCCMTAWTFPGLWSISSKWRKAERGSTLGQGTGQGKLRRIFQGRVVLKSGISPCLRRDSSIKGSQVHTRVAMIGILSPEHLRRDHLAGSKANYMEQSV